MNEQITPIALALAIYRATAELEEIAKSLAGVADTPYIVFCSVLLRNLACRAAEVRNELEGSDDALTNALEYMAQRVEELAQWLCYNTRYVN